MARAWWIVIILARLLVGPDSSTPSTTVLGVTSIPRLVGASNTSWVRLSPSTSYVRRVPSLLLLVMVLVLIVIGRVLIVVAILPTVVVVLLVPRHSHWVEPTISCI